MKEVNSLNVQDKVCFILSMDKLMHQLKDNKVRGGS
jgi:hypothetical protein